MSTDPGQPDDATPIAPDVEDSPVEERGWLAMMAALEGVHTADLAELYARGERCLSVVYGAVESPRDQDDVDELHDALAGLPEVLGGRPDQHLRVSGRADRSTWWWASSDGLPADVIAAHAEHLAHQHARSWWHISQDPV